MNTLECIKTRHSTRKFKADQLSRKLIDQVLDAGRRAPSGGNTQLTHFMVITNQDVLQELVTLLFKKNTAKCRLQKILYLTW